MRTHLVSGVTSGIGQAYANLVRDKGERLIAIIRHDAQRAQIAADDYIVFDFVQPETAQAALAALPTIDVFVNAAGVLHGKHYAEITLSQMQECLAVNLLSPMCLARAVVPHLNDAGVMIFLGSISAHKGSYDDAYAAAKGGLHSFVKSLSLKLAPRHRALVIAPGATQDTRMTDSRPLSELDQVRAQIPLGRLAQAAEIADLIHTCTLPSAASLTGAIIDVNGGQYLR